jgi:hypothetical protein
MGHLKEKTYAPARAAGHSVITVIGTRSLATGP